MKTIGTALCLFLVISVSGGPKSTLPLSKTAVLAQTGTARVVALTASLHRATALLHAASYEEAGERYRSGYQTSKEWGQNELAAQFRCGLGNCQVLRFQYRDALESYLTARRMFAASGSDSQAARVDLNLCSLYSQLGEFGAAADAANRALEHLEPGKVGPRAKLLILLANVKWQQGKVEEARQLFNEGIQEADRFGDPDLLSNAWDKLGARLLLQKQLPQAEQALLEAYRIRKLNRLPALGSTYRNLGMLRLEQAVEASER